MTTRLLAPLLALALLTQARPAGAQDFPPIPPGEDKIVVVREGEKAPFTGQLFSAETSLRWANWLGQYKLRLRTDVAYQAKVDQADLTLAREMLQIERDKYKVVVGDYQERLGQAQVRLDALDAEIRSPSWYRSPWFGLGAGVLGTGIAIGLGAFALHAAK